MELIYDRVQWCAFLYTVINIFLYKNQGIFDHMCNYQHLKGDHVPLSCYCHHYDFFI